MSFPKPFFSLSLTFCLSVCLGLACRFNSKQKNTEEPKPPVSSGQPTENPNNPEAPSKGSTPVTRGDLDAGLPPVDMQGLIGGARPIEVKTPLNFKPQGQLYPLLILLHGFNADADTQDRYLGLSQTALAKGYIFAAPNGTQTIGTGMFPRASTRFWNASESCCDFTSLVARVLRSIKALRWQLSVKPNWGLSLSLKRHQPLLRRYHADRYHA